MRDDADYDKQSHFAAWTLIGDDAFKFCKVLTDVVFPKSLQKIGIGAFLECKSLKTVTFSTGMKKIHESAFDKATQFQAIYVPSKKDRVL